MEQIKRPTSLERQIDRMVQFLRDKEATREEFYNIITDTKNAVAALEQRCVSLSLQNANFRKALELPFVDLYSSNNEIYIDDLHNTMVLECKLMPMQYRVKIPVHYSQEYFLRNLKEIRLQTSRAVLRQMNDMLRENFAQLENSCRHHLQVKENGSC